jgi:2-keto-4-pentenoate hydratase/2-oxohepta-3-ene-1,7-dioic acid hydratase in catechol pathway
MKLVSYLGLSDEPTASRIKLGAVAGTDCVIDLVVAQTWAQGARGFRARELPATMLDLLNNWEDDAPHLQELLAALPADECLALKGAGRKPVARRRDDVLLLPPLPNVLSLRDFNAFEEHVRNTFRLRSKAIPKAWYEAPVFYYANPFTILGPDQAVSFPRGGKALDYELEVACFIGKRGRDIAPEDASDHIAGYTIMNDWSLRDVQMQEMAAGLGPAKGKDFATTLGPALVTPDEFADRQAGEGADLRYDLKMVARVNGQERSRGSLKDIHWTFAQMIARASQDVALYPGEALGSGTVGSGCLLEQGAEDSGEWLKPGDWVELEVERLGVLATQVVEAG